MAFTANILEWNFLDINILETNFFVSLINKELSNQMKTHQHAKKT